MHPSLRSGQRPQGGGTPRVARGDNKKRGDNKRVREKLRGDPSLRSG